MSPKKGQKLKEDTKDTIVKVRVDDETLKKLNYLVEKNSSDRSKVIRRAIEIQYEQLKKEKE